MADYYDLLLRFGLNISAVVVLMFALYYPRYKHKEMVIAGTLFNVFAFAVLSVLSSVQFSVAAGFGLFAILALFTLRSEQIAKSDIAYFFGAISVAVITSVLGTQIEFVLMMLTVVLVAVFVIDHPKVLRSANQMRVTLDSIPSHVVSNPAALNQALSERLGVTVIGVRITSIDYVTEVVKAEVDYRVN